jgi:hypothetical protein
VKVFRQLTRGSIPSTLGTLALLCLSLWATPCHSQAAHDPCSGGMNGASAAYAQSFQRDKALVHTRGFSFRGAGMGALEDILQASDSATAVALLAESGNRHCAYILADHRLVAFGVATVDDEPARTRIARLLEAWRRTAGIMEGPVRGLRTTLLAGVKPARRALPGSAEQLAAVGESLASVLFPGQTRLALFRFRRLVVLPYAGLGAVPYAALPIDSAGALFVDRLAISISPGPRYFGAVQPDAQFASETQRCLPSGSRLPAIVLGDPAAPSLNGQVFPALPGARREAIAVAQQLGVAPILGKEAVRDAVLAQGGAVMIHIAAHGVADSDSPLESYLALSDGRWTAGEIQRTCLHGTRITILSACQSGLGASHDGGIIGLGRAFIIAGSANVAVSLWSVDDAGTEVLMRNFVKALAHTPDEPDRALQSAMLETRRLQPQPFVWAAFALLGRTERQR